MLIYNTNSFLFNMDNMYIYIYHTYTHSIHVHIILLCQFKNVGNLSRTAKVFVNRIFRS